MEGGLILTQDDGFADVVRELRRLAGRMEEINAVVALGSLRNWDARRDQELEIIDRYRTGLTFPFREQIVPSATNNSVFSIMFESPHTRNAALSRLRSQGFETKVYYEPMISGLPNTDYVYARILSLPVYPGIVPEQDTIINILNEAAGECTPGMHYMQASGYLETYLQRDA